MKIICNLIALVFIIIFLAVIYIVKNAALFPHITTIISSNMVLYSFLIGISTFIAGYMFNQAKIENIKSDKIKQLRKAEKADIDTKESLDKINRLNAKIETLETALQNALKNK